MATQLLHFLSSQSLPYKFSSAGDMDELRVLVIGGLVKAEFSGLPSDTEDFAVLAVVHAITALGKQSLRHFPMKNGQSGNN